MTSKLEQLHSKTAELAGLLEHKAELYKKLDRGYTLLVLFPLAKSPFYIEKRRNGNKIIRYIIGCNVTEKIYYDVTPDQLTAEQIEALGV